MFKNIIKVITVGLSAYAGYGLYGGIGAAIGGAIAVIGTWK